MKKLLTILIMLTFAAGLSAAATPNPGLQILECVEDPPGSGIWTYTFFVCTGGYDANDLHIGLVQSEIDEGSVIIGCGFHPDLVGYSSSFTSEVASWVFPVTGPFSCVPGIAGQYLDITIATADDVTVVTETWTLDGSSVGTSTTVITCPPPTSTESSTWGTIKTLFQ